MWKPIESAPKDGTPILLWHQDGHYGIGCFTAETFDGIALMDSPAAWVGRTVYDSDKTRVWMETNGRKHSAVKWQPLPAPPEDV